GQLAVTLTQKNVTDLHVSDRLTGIEYGLSPDDELAAYEFVTTNNSPDRIKIRGLEFEYNQSMAFLGEKFKRLYVRGAYTRIYAELPRANLTPHIASGGLNYTLGRINAYVNWNWTDTYPTNVAGTTMRRHRANLDVGGSVRLSGRYSLALSGRNVTDTPYINLQRIGVNPLVRTRNETVGTSWTLALRGQY
ncbi:MAG TPA: hypothetical protein VGE76_18395, partial [Opitutaceae bacterium]